MLTKPIYFNVYKNDSDNPNAPTNLDEEDGETPYELAEENEHFEVMELLRPYLK